MSADELLKRLQVQAEANRALGQEAAQQVLGAYANTEQQAASGVGYRTLGNASVPQGTALAANYDPATGEVVWVETYSGGESGSQLGEGIPCANGTDCLDTNFCYGWYECDPCDWCENNECVPRDENRPCGATWECPCAPNDRQHYDCVDSACLLTCETNEDCDVGEVCGLTTGYCGPGCQSDAQCDPTNPEAVGDAQANTFCMGANPAEGVGGECVFPCDPVRFCQSDADCFEDEYCGDREYRAASDPAGAIYECISGCRGDSSCEDGETCDPESRSCYRACITDGDCPEGEGCNDDGRCSNVGQLCVSDSDCEAREYCDPDGRCSPGCSSDAGCVEVCEKVASCVDACPPEPGCSCEGEGCYDENWRDYCERDPACVAACPDDPACVRSQGAVCIDNQCERTCSDSSQCLDDEVCSEGLCMVRSSGEGDPADDRLGCGCGDVCNQFGTCEPAICTVDEQCPPCSICEEGTCIEGCSEDNPCPDGQCCNPDGRCSKACRADADCATEPGNQLCLEGGCCGLICEPLVPCIAGSDCGEGQFCGEEGYCLDGCFQDSDCAEGERCDKAFVRLPNGAAAPCEDFPGEQCYSDRGQCVPFCLSASDCGEGESCVDGDCVAPPAPPCVNDASCEPGEICRAGSCTAGCRYDSQCESGQVCRGNFCELACSSTEVCKALDGDDSTCVDGICVVINEGGPGEGGRQGCECFEFCDKDGYCVPYQCSSDLQCEEEACGSCLSSGVCGACFTDADCPGAKVCDRQEVCDDNGENCQPDPQGGTCAYACTPGGPGVCIGNSDCPDGFYCDGGECQRGCQENDDCQPGTVCRGEACVPACVTDGQCAANHRCIQGGCRFVGQPCDPENAQAQLVAEQIERGEAQIAEVQAQIDALEQQENISEADEQRIAELGYQLETLEEQQETYQAQLEDARNSGCPGGQQCNGDQCEPIPPDCLDSIECQAPAECVDGSCVEPPTSEDFRAFEPAVIGCQSCAEVCDQGICRPATCQQDGDCPCGFCGRDGRCREECLTDFDCASGVCDQGECLECRTNGDCSEYGLDAVCDAGECKTPCYTGLSTGSCGSGLSYGDTCHACPDSCPSDAPCKPVNEVCSVQEVYDPITRTTRTRLGLCYQCSKSCSSSSDCEEGYVCNGFGICVSSDGRCTFDSDCVEDGLAAGVEMACRNNVCIELGTTCFTRSDCDPGEVCDGFNCVKGSCGDNDPCQAGKVCADNECRWQCGSGAEVFLCGDNGSCPPGFYCANDGAYGAYCLRPGMRFSEITEPGCPVGEVCCGGACVPLGPGKQCCDSEQCSGDQECCDGICKASCDDSTTATDDDQGAIDDGEVEPQDNCERQGKCCQDDGWCGPCGCDEKNPCPGNQCCDRDSGQCVSIDSHPNTRYGAPYSCDVDPVFCELLGPEGDDGERSTIEPESLGGADYRGCEVYDPVRQLSRCWEGGPKSAQQVRQLLAAACWEPSTKQCRCDEIPSEDECATDQDCGACGRCEQRTFRSDACCGIYGEGEYETTQADGSVSSGVDYIRRNVCVQEDGEAEECGCRSNDDCTECEACVGGGPDRLGYCQPQCEERCPCGGELSRGGTCPSCVDRYGTCATESTFVVTPGGFDPVTGEEIPEESACACVLDRSKDCCKGHQELSDLLRQRYRCEFRQQVYGDGTVEVLSTETCLDPNEDQCAQCEVDAHCPGSQVCKGYRCVSECGKQDGDPDSAIKTSDRQDTGGIGGDPYTCWCCSEAGECRAKYETWIESKEKQLGPWRITYAAEDGVRREWNSEQEQYASAIAELKAAFPGQDLDIINADGENSEGECRPCECGDTGIQCGPYAPCNGCYEWRPDGDPSSLEVGRAETLRLEAELAEVENALGDCDDQLTEQQERVTEAEGAYLAARQFFSQFDRDLGAQLEALYAQQEEENDLVNQIGSELWAKRRELAKIERDLALAGAADNQDAMALLSADLNSTEQEISALEDNYDSAVQNLNETEAEIEELERQLRLRGEDSQLAYDTLEQRRQQFLALLAGLQSMREDCDALRTRRGELLTDVQKQQNPRSVSYSQQRTCECCIDGVCRPESECTYGICYQCIDEYSGEYRAALYGKVLGQRISRDTPMPAGDDRTPMIKGKTEWKYKVEEDTCVRYPCAGGWYREERPGTIRNVRYYEYCTGSILGCVLSYNKTKVGDYLQGWKYEVQLDQAGVYFTSDYVNWVKMGAYEGSGVRKAECLYNNPLGFLGGSDLGVFYELVATHPVCNFAELWLECPPEEPFCSAKYGTLYESGAPDLQIKRLEREIAQLEALIAALLQARGQLDTLEQVKRDERDAIQQQLYEAVAQLEAAQANLAALQQQLQQLEQQITDAQTLREQQQQVFDERLDTYVTIGEMLSDAIDERIAAEQDVAGAEYQRQVARDNLSSAASLANTLYLQANALKAQIQELREQLANTEPNTLEAAQIEVQIAEREQELEQVNGERSAAVSDMLGYEEEIAALDRLISVSSCEETTGGGTLTVGGEPEDCRSLQQRVADAREEEDRLRGFYGVAFGAYRRAREDLEASALLLSSLANQRNQVSEAIADLERQVEDLTELAGESKYDPELCEQEGYEYRFVQTGGSVNGQPFGQRRCCLSGYPSCTDWYPAGGYKRDCVELCEQIEAVDAVLENIRVSRQEVNAQITASAQQKAEKQAEIARLEDESEIPNRLEGPVPRPTGKVKTAAELQEELQANIDVDQFLAEQDSWIPGATSEA